MRNDCAGPLQLCFCMRDSIEETLAGISERRCCAALLRYAGGGIRTHEGLRHRISRPEADLKFGTTYERPTCPFDLTPAHAMWLWVSGTPADIG